MFVGKQKRKKRPIDFYWIVNEAAASDLAAIEGNFNGTVWKKKTQEMLMNSVFVHVFK